MLKRHFYYYLLKPYVPTRMRLALRRIVARWKRKKYKAVWPIDEAAGRTPEGWPGWPDGKKFAVVLTHDVEGPDGLAKCQELAELEIQLGFRSSFNFIPEGSYSVSEDLRTWLTANGFEVGVHDLHHDGKLFASRHGFEKKAKKINHYLCEWKASGYRSGFMLRNLDWLHDLDIRYDASTFDTDPFEPQSDGAGTIFPFWIPALETPGAAGEARSPGQTSGAGSHSNGGSPVPAMAKEGYVELPYTLPQDSTLFMLLEEKTGDIWDKKLDWVASHGGMVLINVHPDYLHLKSEGTGNGSTAGDRYGDWLRYLKKSYGDSFWHVLPREMAAFVDHWKHGTVWERPLDR